MAQMPQMRAVLAESGPCPFMALAGVSCPLLALSGHALVHCKCPLSGVKRTCLLALHMSAYDPKRTELDKLIIE
jgi:hypothetical protein